MHPPMSQAQYGQQQNNEHTQQPTLDIPHIQRYPILNEKDRKIRKAFNILILLTSLLFISVLSFIIYRSVKAFETKPEVEVLVQQNKTQAHENKQNMPIVLVHQQTKVNNESSSKKTTIDSAKPLQSKKIKSQIFLSPHSIGSYLQRAETRIKQPEKYFDISSVQQLRQLPFCLLLFQHFDTKIKKQIEQSITKQNYSNTKIKQISEPLASNYNELLVFMKKQCTSNSLVIFVNTPLAAGSLSYLNTLHQQVNCWVTYNSTEEKIQVVSFYLRVFQLINKKDFKGTNKKYITNNTRQVQTICILEICAWKAKKIHLQYFVANFKDEQYLFASKYNPIIIQRQQLIPNQRLSQDFENKIIFDPKWKKSAKIKDPLPSLNLTRDTMLRAIDYQQLWYLPRNHSVAIMENQYYQQKYNLQKYRQLEHQTPFCVTVLNFNNVESERYKKLLVSIFEQNYNNFHLLIIDDNSSDGYLKLAQQFILEYGFPKKKIRFVSNNQKLFATYNIINAVYNFCSQHEVQILLDGDDQIIGRQAFAVINSAYQEKHDVWVVYSNYKSNLYHFGRSRAVFNEIQHLSNNKRVFISYIGPIRSWKVKLIYQIPLQYHTTTEQKWLETAYDDALQYCLLELSGVSRIVYIPEVLYEYNRKYGNNDDATPARLKYRNQTYEKYILQKTPLSRLQDLEKSTKNKRVQELLQRDNNKKYKQIQW